ncbi:MAG TPA: hypothetical protein VIU12_06565 [Chryseolinea sp.]
MNKKITLLASFVISLFYFTTSAQTWTGSTVIVGGSSLLGTYSTSSVIEVQNPLQSWISLRKTGSATPSLNLGLSTDYNQCGLWVNGGLPLSFTTEYATRMIILPQGNVGIGTTVTGLTSNPNGYLLAVNGKIGAKEVLVENTSSTWADYVFKPDYKLMNLSDVELYILNNRHLPEIPSDEEIKVKGHNLGEMDVLLLKKVEELTLYMIQLKKEVDLLKMENEKLKAQVR